MSKAGTLIGGVFAVAGLGYGGYYMNQYTQVNKALANETAAQTMIEGSKKQLKGFNASIAENEGRRTALGKSYEEAQKAAQAMEAQLDAARKEVQRLEAEYESKQQNVHKVAKDLESVASKISALKADVERATSAVTMGEKSLQIARQQAAEARKLLNPLNHPKVQSLMGGRK